MTEQEITQATENVRKLTDGTLLRLITSYIRVGLHTTLDNDSLEMKAILTNEAFSRRLMR